MQNPNWIRTILASIALAILLKIGFAIPLMTSFVALGIIYLAQVVATEMRPGLDTAKGWLKFMGNAILGVVAFLALRLIATSLLGLPLAATYQKLEDSGGLYWTLFGADVSNVILWEILFAIVAGGLVALWVRGKGGKLVMAVFVIAFLVTSLQVRFPKSASAVSAEGAMWDAKLESRIKEKGALGAILPDTGAGGEWKVVRAVSDRERAVKLPYLHWFDINTEAPVVVRTANGDEFLWKPDDTIVRHAGGCKEGEQVEGIRDIPNSILYLRACGNKIVRVGITVEPATMQAYESSR